MLLIGPTDRPRKRRDENSQFHLLMSGPVGAVSARVLAVYGTLTEKGLRIWDVIAKSEASALESLLVQAQPR